MLRYMGLWIALLTSGLAAQTVQPVITEYKGSGDGKFAVTNNTLSPMVVVLEPRSFDVNEDGKGIYRDLDRTLRVELSDTSFTLQPQQTRYVFYHASSETLPNWFTIYATFASAAHSTGLDMRLMLPHTVYLYGKRTATEDQIQLSGLTYDPQSKKLTGTLLNTGNALIRVQSVRATGSGGTGDAGGFPLLPGRTRRLTMDWASATPPAGVEIRFPHFTLKQPVPGLE